MHSSLQACVHVRINAGGAVSRRGFLRNVAGLAAGGAGLRWSQSFSAFAGEMKKRGKACILLWMAGGPSQFETLDPKPEAPNQGPTRAIDTDVAGIRIAEHWTKLAGVMKELAVIRSMTSREGNHGRAT